MKNPRTIKTFKDQFLARTQYARIKAKKTQAQMAIDLGLAEEGDDDAQSKYQKYETRSYLPHHLIEQFCGLVGESAGWLYSGPVVARQVEKRGRKPKKAKPKAA